jgi:hypothetical protein
MCSQDQKMFSVEDVFCPREMCSQDLSGSSKENVFLGENVFSSLSRSISTLLALSRAPRGGVTRQGVVLTDLQSPLDCQ